MKYINLNKVEISLTIFDYNKVDKLVINNL